MTTISVSDSMKKIYPIFTDSIPHVATYLDSSALSAVASDTPKNIFLVGSADDGNPNNVYEVTSLLQAKGIFGSGDLVNAMNMIWDSSSDDTATSGGTVFAVRVEDATQATLTKGSVSFTSKVWGANANKIQVGISKEALTGGLSVEVSYPVKNYDVTYSNIGNIFSLAYDGTASAAAYTVETDSNGNATTLNLLTGDTLATATVLKSFDLTTQNYAEMYQVIQAINIVPGFTAVALGFANSIASSYLDGVNTPVQIQGNSTVNVTAFLGGLLYALADDTYVIVAASGTVTPTSVTTDGTTVTAGASTVPDEFDLTNLAGASDGTVPVSWADKFELVQSAYTDDTEAPYYIVALTDQANIHSELKEYCEEQADYGYNYIGFVGCGLGETVDQAIARQVQLKSSRIMLSATSGYYTTISGTKLQVPGYMVGALAAGVASGLQIGGPLTNKSVNMTSIDQNYSMDDLNRLDQNGCLAIKHVVNRNQTGGYEFVEDVTTYCSTSDTVKNLMSLVELTDFLFDDLRYYLDKNYIGTNISENSADLVKSHVASFLDTKVSDGLIASYSESDIQVIIDGRNVYITFTVDPSLEVRNILVYGTYGNYTDSSSNDEGTSTD